MNTPKTRSYARYSPRLLGAARWDVAADACVEAVAAVPASDAARTNLLSTLTGFLNSPVWDGQSAPVLVDLLTDANIVAYSELLPANRTRTISRSNLRRVARAVGAAGFANTPTVTTVRPYRRPSVLLVEGAKRPVPAADLLNAWAATTGNTWNAGPLEPVIEHWRRSGASTVANSNASTVPASSSLRALTEVSHQPEKATVTSSSKNHPSPNTPTRPMSRRAAIAQAKKARAAAVAATQPAVVAAAPTDIPDSIREVVEAFCPRAPRDTVWNANTALAHRIVFGHVPPSRNNAKTVCTYVARFLDWYAGSAHRLEAGYTGPVIAAEELLDPALVEHFLHEVQDMPDRAKSTTRSALRRAVGSLNPSAKPMKVPHHPALAPYTSRECAQFVSVALHQPTAATRANLALVVGLSLGAGLDASDLDTLSRDSFTTIDLEDETTALLVTTGRGSQTRTVPIRADYVHLVELGLELHRNRRLAADAPLIGPSRSTKAVGRAIDLAKLADGSDLVLDIRRLRNTWLVCAMCSPVPLADLMRASGLTTGRTLANLMPYCPPSDPATVDRVLVAMADVLNGPTPSYAKAKKANR